MGVDDVRGTVNRQHEAFRFFVFLCRTFRLLFSCSHLDKGLAATRFADWGVADGRRADG